MGKDDENEVIAMNFRSKVTISLLTLIACLAIVTASIFASNPDSAKSSVLVRIGGSEITSKDLEKYKTFRSMGENLVLDNSKLLEELITEKLYVQLAEEQGVAAPLTKGKQEAEKYRKILEQQPQKIKNVQKKLIEVMGITEEDYWNIYAPAEYQKFQSMQNLTQHLINSNKLDISSPDFAKQLADYKHELFQSALHENKIEVIDKSIEFK